MKNVAKKQQSSKSREWIDLADQSPKDKPWDRHRGTGERVADIFETASEPWIEKQGSRIAKCAPWLRFHQTVQRDTGELGLKLDTAFFCRVRSCPVCQWRRSLMWKARMFHALPKLAEAYPAARWIFLTLTQKNCEITDLRTELAGMGKAWKRMLDRKEFSSVLGWCKSIEITRGADGSAHPHIHALLLVKSTYFKGSHYITQERWTQAWREAGRLDYDPVVNVKAVRGKGNDGIEKAVAETLKYAVKPSDMTTDPDWFLELTWQVRNTRAVSSGGVLSGFLKEETDARDLLTPDPEIGPEGEPVDRQTLKFNWRTDAGKYQRRRAAGS